MRVFEIDKTKCLGCMGCLTSCPVEAIGVREDGVSIDHGRCVACGTCFHRCGHGAVTQISEVEKVRGFLKDKRKVILSIDPACIAYLPKGLSVEHLAAAAQKLGFWDVADASEAAAAVSREYARLLSEKDMDNLVFSACPVVRNLMEQMYPETLKYLAPVASPMIAHGRMLKRDFTSAAVVYVSTCAARLEESKDVRHSTEINAVLSIGELLTWLRQEGIELDPAEEEPLLSDGGGLGELSAISGGMTECLEYFLPEHGRKKLCVDGIQSCKALLEELKKGNIHGCILEMNACPGGCVGGTDGIQEVGEKRGRFSAALHIRNYVDQREKTPYFDTHGIAMLNPNIDYSVSPYVPSEGELQEMLYQIGVGNLRQQKNCGKCGYSTCRARAEAILLHREAVSICRQVVQDTRRDVYSVLYENLPMAALLIDENQQVVDFNQEAASLFSLKRGQEKYIFEIMDPGDVQYVLSTGLAIRNKRVDIPEHFLRVETSLVPLKTLNMVLAVFLDITEEEAEEEKRQQSRLQSVEMAQKVIDKQMSVAQQIAYLLGETTAETKVTLNQLKARIMDGEEDAL